MTYQEFCTFRDFLNSLGERCATLERVNNALKRDFYELRHYLSRKEQEFNFPVFDKPTEAKTP